MRGAFSRLSGLKGCTLEPTCIACDTRLCRASENNRRAGIGRAPPRNEPRMQVFFFACCLRRQEDGSETLELDNSNLQHYITCNDRRTEVKRDTPHPAR